MLGSGVKLSSNVVSVLSLISGHVDMPEMSSLPDVCLARDLAVECLFRVLVVGDGILKKEGGSFGRELCVASREEQSYDVLYDL